MDEVGQRAHGRDGAQDVARVGAGDEACLGGQQGLKGVGGELRVRGRGCGRLPPLELQLEVLGEGDPGGNVGFVVEGAADDLGAGREVRAQSRGEVAEELGGGGTDDSLVGAAVDVVCGCLDAGVVAFCGSLADPVGRTELDVVLEKVVFDAGTMSAQSAGGGRRRCSRINHSAEDLTSTSVIQALVSPNMNWQKQGPTHCRSRFALRHSAKGTASWQLERRMPCLNCVYDVI
ncbi:hypothetical protein FH972_022605 [Carpinus fangiana]|uniref:Uncharacterized protein n=1 Tax=Carpinus fangiana TaxID=176857 RepID=A0A5N6KTA4_9ROSI|nr:hypothetical protein FH972_022605 [Carpinus fangiana]